jgi:hypothetical protein
LDGSEYSQFSGDSKLIPATVIFSAKVKEVRKQKVKISLEDINFIVFEFVFLGFRVNG